MLFLMTILNEIKSLVLVRTLDPIVENNLFKQLNISLKLILTKKAFLKYSKNIFIENISKDIWWKNFLCLEGAFKKLVCSFLFFLKSIVKLQFCKKVLEKSNNIIIFLTKISLFAFFLKLFFILKWLLKVDFIIKFYNLLKS